MRWTSHPPTRPGFYWSHAKPERHVFTPVSVVEVIDASTAYVSRDNVVYVPGEECEASLDEFDAWGDEPVQLPEGDPQP
jgi:hypothetical protein